MAEANDHEQPSATNGHATRPALQDPESYDLTGPGTLAGRYLRRFWQPVFVAAELPAGHAKPIRIMSEDFTLYRGQDGTPHVVAPRCAHRGTQLSTGWVEGDCLRCFYHGWKYDSTGQCVEMPAEDVSFPPKVQIESYPTEEYLGLIFAYLGEGEPPPLPRWPEFEEEGVRESGKFFRECNYFQNLENGIDEVHVHWAHRVVFSDSSLGVLPRVSAEETDYGMVQYGHRPGQPTRVTHFHMPNVLQVQNPPQDAESGWMDALRFRVPVDDERHVSFNVNLTRVTGAAAERFRQRQAEQRAGLAALPPAQEIVDAVLRGELRSRDIRDRGNRPDVVNLQDHIAQVGQGAIVDRTHERLGRSDAAIILLRQLWTRELRALAEGRPLKRWTRPSRLAATSGV